MNFLAVSWFVLAGLVPQYEAQINNTVFLTPTEMSGTVEVGADLSFFDSLRAYGSFASLHRTPTEQTVTFSPFTMRYSFGLELTEGFQTIGVRHSAFYPVNSKKGFTFEETTIYLAIKGTTKW